MANISSTASAAALAAFNATAKAKEPEPSKLPSHPYNLDKNTSIQSLPVQSKSHKRVISPRPTGPSLQISLPNNGMRRSSTLDVPGGISQRGTPSPRYESQGSRKSPNPSPRVLSSNSTTSGDYFSDINRHTKINSNPQDMINNIKQSIDSKAIVNDANAKRLSANYSPQEMIKNLRSSIHSKTKTSSANLSNYDKSPKGQQILNDIRDRIDTRMKAVSESSSHPTGSARTESSIRSVSNPSKVYNATEINNSYSSFGSSFSERESAVEEEDQEEPEEEPEEPEVIEEINITRSDELEQSSVKSKPRRKPPPDQECMEPKDTTFYFADGNSRSFDALSSASSLGNADETHYQINQKYDYTEDDTLESESQSILFPQFPDVTKRRDSKNNIFKKKKSKRIESPLNLLDSDSEIEELPSPLVSSSALVQPVQFKTTMREKRRKDKKTQFNENKPWKNHSDLNYLSEQERKRYEGVWASNKGNYMSQIVTRLVGVDYSSVPEVAQEDEEISTKAAKLSSNNQAQSINDKDNVHNLENADINQLIHGMIVSRIWRRSRLPDETLEQIWNLVDFRKDGTLNKNEFLVGMWLVDQCLYGRKLPKKVEPIVWDSLGGIGVNVTIKKKNRR